MFIINSIFKFFYFFCIDAHEINCRTPSEPELFAFFTLFTTIVLKEIVVSAVRLVSPTNEPDGHCSFKIYVTLSSI